MLNILMRFVQISILLEYILWQLLILFSPLADKYHPTDPEEARERERKTKAEEQKQFNIHIRISQNAVEGISLILICLGLIVFIALMNQNIHAVWYRWYIIFLVSVEAVIFGMAFFNVALTLLMSVVGVRIAYKYPSTVHNSLVSFVNICLLFSTMLPLSQQTVINLIAQIHFDSSSLSDFCVVFGLMAYYLLNFFMLFSVSLLFIRDIALAFSLRKKTKEISKRKAKKKEIFLALKWKHSIWVHMQTGSVCRLVLLFVPFMFVYLGQIIIKILGILKITLFRWGAFIYSVGQQLIQKIRMQSVEFLLAISSRVAVVCAAVITIATLEYRDIISVSGQETSQLILTVFVLPFIFSSIKKLPD